MCCCCWCCWKCSGIELPPPERKRMRSRHTGHTGHTGGAGTYSEWQPDDRSDSLCSNFIVEEDEQNILFTHSVDDNLFPGPHSPRQTQQDLELLDEDALQSEISYYPRFTMSSQVDSYFYSTESSSRAHLVPSDTSSQARSVSGMLLRNTGSSVMSGGGGGTAARDGSGTPAYGVLSSADSSDYSEEVSI